MLEDHTGVQCPLSQDALSSLASVIHLGPRTSLADPEKKKREFKHTSLSFFKQTSEGGKV